ncbi:MAG: DMT superfamily drug/metabolite permease [Ignavibacteria bacterium]|nr:MAG: DMT superfamily drug/metabolite permease [Ignavibacteria bacterium]KAF0161099.1 MAG: DMT superfamily drug/metabolite permease [Ignavibacteria bacterium]
MKKIAPLLVIIAASLWGIDGIVLRPSLYSLPVPLVVFVETGIVALILFPILTKNFAVIKNLSAKDWFSFIGVGLLGGAVGTMAITKALFHVNFVNLSVVILIQKLQPVFALGLAAIILKERLPKKFFLWAGLAVSGAYLMTFGFSLPNFSTGEKTIVAAALSLVAAFSFGSSTVLSKLALKNVAFEVGTYLRFLISAVIMFSIASLTGDITSAGEITNTQWTIFILIAFTTGGAAIFLYYYGLKKISASVATICELAFPLTAVILDYIVRGTVLSIIQWLGVALLVLSIIKVSGVTFISEKEK